MKKFFVLLAVVGMESRSALAEPPSQQVLRVTEKGEWWIYRQLRIGRCVPEVFTVTVKVPIEQTRTVERNGRTVTEVVTKIEERIETRTRSVMHWEIKQLALQILPETLQASELDGRRISQVDLKRRLKGDTLVLVGACDGSPLPASYAAVFKPGTIFLRGNFTCAAPLAQAPPNPEAGEGMPAPKFPTAPEPRILTAQRQGSDTLQLRWFEEMTNTQTAAVKNNDSSVSPERLIQVEHQVRHSESTSLPWRVVRASTADGKPVADERIRQTLGSAETTLLVSGDGAAVDKFWLQNVKPGTWVLHGFEITPPAPVAYPAAPVPVGATGGSAPAPAT